jgi:hypothetical protein
MSTGAPTARMVVYSRIKKEGVKASEVDQVVIRGRE